MWSWIASFLGGPIINGLLSAYREKLAAGNTSEKIAAELTSREIALLQREQDLRAHIVVAEQGNWFTRSVRPLWAMPFVLFTWKAVVWDKVFGWGTTDDLGNGSMGWLLITIATAYFVGRSAETIARIIKR